ncbi:MAG: MATE family efflux transporter [Solobacterium sp.]|nr:MATE family efflux transporter [Solobacterium sp.]
MSSRKAKMAEMPIPQLVLDMGFPLMFSLLIQSLYNIVDGIFVSRVSEKALTATSLAFPVQHLMIAVSVGLAVGLNAVMARTAGSGDRKKAGNIAAEGMVIALGISLVFAVLGLLFARVISAGMTDDAETARMTASYMGFCVIFSQGIFAEKVAQRTLTAAGLSRWSMYSQLTAAVSNIILDPILIFGLFGLPALGITGAAIATVAGQWLGAVIAVWANYRFNTQIRFSFRDLQFSRDDLRSVLRIGMPTMITQSLGSLMTALINGILMPVSASAVAFFGIYYKLQNFVYMPVNGLGQAVLPITAFTLGAGNKQRLREVWHWGIRYALYFCAAGSILFELFPGQLLSLFNAGEEMYRIGIPALRIIALTFPFAAYTYISGYYCSGLGNAMVNMTGGMLRQVIVLVPLVWILMKMLGLGSVWYAFWFAEISAFLFCYCRVRKEKAKYGI